VRDKSDILEDIISGKHTELEAKEPPPQHLPAIIRWGIRGIIWPFMVLDLSIQRCLRFFVRSPHKLRGRCNGCGVCCRYILLEWAGCVEKYSWLGRIYLWWMTEINGFYLLDFDFCDQEGSKYLLMGCRYLSKKRCRHYLMRPAICHHYPWVGYFRRPGVLPKCGYKSD
jgi:hypothetical protein